MTIEKDPVCGMECTNSKITCEYKGKTYRFCSEACRITFNLDPEKYVKKD